MLETYADSQEGRRRKRPLLSPLSMHCSKNKAQQIKESTEAHSVKAKTLYVFNNPKTNAIEWTALSALFILGKYFQRKTSYVGP